MERDARGRAADAIERRARQREAAALAQQALTPEAVEAEKKRQVENAALIHGGDVLAPSPPMPVDEIDPVKWEPGMQVPEDGEWPSLSDKLAEAVQPVLDGSEEPDESDSLGAGRAVIQWILVPSDDEENEDGYQLGLQVQVDEQAPGGVVLEITTEMLDRWKAGVGLQKNRTEHKRFAAGIIERAVELAALETGNSLIWTLEQLMLDAPTETSVGEDEVSA